MRETVDTVSMADLLREYGHLVSNRNRAADYMDKLEAENARLRRALEWYADEENWLLHAHTSEPGAVKLVCNAYDADRGDIARAALKGEGE